jgi:protein-tyrosine phosphatase
MFDAGKFGGRRAYVNDLTARALAVLGIYSGMLDVDWRAVERLVFVCKGNICRSPYAAERARLSGLETASMGLEADDGASANASAQRNAQLRKVDLSAHRSTRVVPEKLRSTDLVLLFEPWQVKTFKDRCGAQAPTASLIGLWASPRHPYLCDPYGRSDACFQQCFTLIDNSVTELARLMRS